jgi:hypothetical protein
VSTAARVPTPIGVPVAAARPVATTIRRPTRFLQLSAKVGR